MFNANPDGLDRNSDDVGSQLATERHPAIPGLAGFTCKFLAVVRRAL